MCNLCYEKEKSSKVRLTTIDSPAKRKTSVPAYIIYGWCNKNHLLYRTLVIVGVLLIAHAIVVIIFSHIRPCKMSNVAVFMQTSGGATLAYFLLGAFLLCLALCQTKDSEEYCTVDNVVGGLVYFAYLVVISEFIILIVGTVYVLSKMQLWTPDDEKSQYFCDNTVFLLASSMLIIKWILVSLAIVRMLFINVKKCMKPVTE